MHIIVQLKCVRSSKYIDSCKEINNEDPKFINL